MASMCSTSNTSKRSVRATRRVRFEAKTGNQICSLASAAVLLMCLNVHDMCTLKASAKNSMLEDCAQKYSLIAFAQHDRQGNRRRVLGLRYMAATFIKNACGRVDGISSADVKENGLVM
eukprot:3964143-Pleurochrysis_carterae.AAC.2